jgi:hypothetical protein
MSINAQAVHDMLDTQVRKGRTLAEAAGEGLWQAEVNQQLRILSRASHDEMINVVNEWLAAQVSPEDVALYTLVAGLYARFPTERVRFGPGEEPIAMLEDAWREWRRTMGG